ncbi:hypothetical protein [Erythrobacter sp. JK5]|uniref:hypothetical protein n=1 Tax=Erythrobacter sp. JK5 TaxID=2829500 RepID=UPI001BA995EE|nr:hypothetical protein [Erythrobacter sp. JK5]QUL39209.1 hypothetical protein KDC96_07815 [Erythrobacter sp. JK5]
MSKHVKDIVARGEARIVAAPEVRAEVRHQVEVDRNFELPAALYAATAGCFFAFLAITGIAFASPGLAIPMAIFAVFIVAAFGVPTIWTRLKKNGLEPNDTSPMTTGQFGEYGIMTHTGRLMPRDAAIQVLILPVLVVLWGLAAVTIAALV